MLILTSTMFAQEFEAGRYRITFTDKNESPFSIDNPEEFLSQKAIARRTKFNIAITEQDLPVNPQYVGKIKETNAILCNTSKWFNSAIFYIDTITKYNEIKALSFIKKIEYVAPKPVYKEDVQKLSKQDTIKKDFSVLTGEDKQNFKERLSSIYKAYGLSIDQNMMLGTVSSHITGHQGQGMTIAIIDAGFLHVDSIAVFQKMRDDGRLLGTFDVTGMKECLDIEDPIYTQGSHGMTVLSLIGGFYPNKLIGTAPQANFILLHSEEEVTEHIVEEDNWVAAAEIADSAGADIISTSLGYSEFDNARQSHIYSEMDGNSCIITKGADIASSKGMLCVISAGNSGDEDWKYITAPADADSVITVGACDRNEKKVKFSSFGPTSDGRTKPDLMALGLFPTIVTDNGTIKNASGGTSFACPLISGCCATLWEEFPDSTAQTIKRALMQTASRAKKPNNKYGYGIPNVLAARNYLYAEQLYNFLSNDYILPDFNTFFKTIWNNGNGVSLQSSFVFLIQTNKNGNPSFIVRDHNYEAIKLPEISEKGGKVEIMVSTNKSISVNIKQR